MNQTALITGGSSGIGYELARQFAAAGYNLVLVAREPEKLEEAKTKIAKDYPVEIITLAYDLSDREAPQKIYNELLKQKLSVEVLVNCAGFGDFAPFVMSDWHKQQSMIGVNVTALTHLTHLFLPGMLERKRGGVINIASTAAFQPGPLMSVYYATKAYVLSFSEALANELTGTGVTVTCICPGATKSGFQKAAANEDSRLVKGRKLPSAEEVARFAYRAFVQKRVVAVHGFVNYLQTLIVRFLPRSWVVAGVRQAQQKDR